MKPLPIPIPSDLAEVLDIHPSKISHTNAGFGVFLKVRQEAVDRPNPQDRTKMVHTPARNTVRFRPAPALKAAVQ